MSRPPPLPGWMCIYLPPLQFPRRGWCRRRDVHRSPRSPLPFLAAGTPCRNYFRPDSLRMSPRTTPPCLFTPLYSSRAACLQSRALGGTVGLAQCGAVLNGKVTSLLRALLTSGTISPQDAALLQNGLASGITSVQGISSLPAEVQQYVRDAFQQGTRWAIISLLPWAGVSFLLTIFLSNIHDTDKEARMSASANAAQGQDSEVKPADEGEPHATHELEKSEV